MPDQNAINQQEWENPGNWKSVGFLIYYRSRRDSRLLVPRPPNPRWPVLARSETVNVGHRRAWWMMLGLSSVPIGLLLLFVLVQLFK